MIVQIIMAYLASAGFSVVFNSPKWVIAHAGLIGAAGWLIYLISMIYVKSTIFAVFIATFCVTILSRIFAVRKKTPLTVFLIAGIIPFVPGIGIYNTMYEIINGKSLAAFEKAVEAFETAGVIAIGIIIALSLPIGEKRRKRL